MARRQERPQLRINRQTPPTRCDICHQSDNYDPINGNCSRCNPSLELKDDIVLVDDTEDVLESLSSVYARATQQQPTREENNHSLSQSPNTISQQANALAATVLTADNRGQQLLDDREQILDRRQERIGIRELALNQRQTALDDRERVVNQKQTAIDEREEILAQREEEQLNSRIANRPASIHWNLRLIGAVVFVVIILFLVFAGGNHRSDSSALTINASKIEPISIVDNNANEPSQVQTEAEIQAQTSADEEIPYALELDSNPEKIEENPIVVLAVGNVTTLELNEAAKNVVVGDNETIEIKKSLTHSKKIYLIGKAPINNTNIVIETTSKTITIFCQVIENVGVGGFNGEVIISSKLNNK